MILMSCTLLIRACMDSMTDTEKRIADYLLVHGSEPEIDEHGKAAFSHAAESDSALSSGLVLSV